MIHNRLLIFLLVFTTAAAQAKDMHIFVSHAVFYSERQGPYVEAHFKIPVASLTFKPAGKNTWRAGVTMEMAIFRADSLVYAEKFSIAEPDIKDTSANVYLRALKRVALPNGVYKLVFFAVDEHDTLSSGSSQLSFKVDVPPGLLTFGDIILLDTAYVSKDQTVYTRWDYDFLPAVSSVAGTRTKSLRFYTEAYNASQIMGGDDVHFRMYLKDVDGLQLPGYRRTRVRKAQPLNYIFETFDITRLSGGEYFVCIDAMNKNGEVLARREKYFIRLTDSLLRAMAGTIPHVPADSIRKFGQYLAPIATGPEMAYFNRYKDGADTMALKKWFYTFWADRNADDPPAAFHKYANAIAEANRQYSTMIVPGWKTDRGYIFLKYGRPDGVAQSQDEPAAYPYEIWHYYRASSQSNVRFVFYSPTQLHNDFVLLHSDMIGERNNPNWKKMIYRKTNQDKSVDDDTMPNDYGNQLDQRMRE